jgi:hypothetical protein
VTGCLESLYCIPLLCLLEQWEPVQVRGFLRQSAPVGRKEVVRFERGDAVDTQWAQEPACVDTTPVTSSTMLDTW